MENQQSLKTHANMCSCVRPAEKTSLDQHCSDIHPEIMLVNTYGISSEVYMADAFT